MASDPKILMPVPAMLLTWTTASAAQSIPASAAPMSTAYAAETKIIPMHKNVRVIS